MELKLLQFKFFFIKFYGFIKSHFVEIFFAIVGVYAVFLAKKKQEVIQQLIADQQTAREQNKKNIDDLTKQIEEQISKRRKIESDYQDFITQINERHDRQIKEIAEIKEKEIKDLISKHQGDPTKMAQTINELFGIPIMGVTDK